MNDQQPLVSVVVPVYNVEPYLRRCLDSIVGQTYRNIEIILVDDGSPDACGRICEEYAANDTRIRVIHQENRGLSGARNSGMDAATGEYLMFIDSDDLIDFTMAEKMVNKAKETDADVVQCRFYFLKDDQDTLDSYSDPIPGAYDGVILDEKNLQEFFFAAITDFSMSSVCNKMIRRSLVESFGLRFVNERTIGYEDELFRSYLCATAGKISAVNEPLYYYFERENSLMHVPRLRIPQVMEMVWRFEQFCCKHGKESLLRKFLPIYAIHCVIAEFTRARWNNHPGYWERLLIAAAQLHELPTARRYFKKALFSRQLRRLFPVDNYAFAERLKARLMVGALLFGGPPVLLTLVPQPRKDRNNNAK